MKSIIFFVSFFVGYASLIDAQVQMNITQLIISQLKRGDSFQKTEKVGNETKIVRISRENAEDTPHLDAIVEIKNISDSLIILFPNSSELEIVFRLDGRLYKQKINFYVKNIDGTTNYLSEYVLNPGERLLLDAGGYVIETGTKLEMITQDINNFSNLLLKILPTLKYQYIDKSGITIIQNEIYDVKLE